MPFVNGIYQPDQSSPLDRLYRFKTRQDQMEKAQMEMEQARQQQALAQQRPGILAEYYTPEQEAIAASGPAAYSPDANPADFAGQLFMRQQAAQEARPASFDRDGAINRLYGVGDIEGADKLIAGDYRQALGNRAGAGSAEKWYGNSKTIKGPDGKLYNQLLSSAGNVKLVPVDGDLTGELKQMDVGGKKVWINSYTGQPVTEFEVTPTAYQSWQMDDRAQADQQEAVNEAGARGTERGKQQAGKEADATNAGSQIAAIDRIMTLADQGYYSGTLDDRVRMSLADTFGFGADDPRYANTGSIHTLAANLLPQAKPSAMGGVSNSEWDMIREIISDPKKGSPQRYKAALGAYKSLLEGKIAAAEGGFKNAVKGYGAAGGQPGQARPASKVMPSMPNPAQHKGRIIRDTKTGISYQSNGSQWVRVK